VVRHVVTKSISLAGSFSVPYLMDNLNEALSILSSPQTKKAASRGFSSSSVQANP
jgi:hypothetical protein